MKPNSPIKKSLRTGITLVELSIGIAAAAIATTAVVTFLFQSNILSLNTTHASNSLSSKVILFSEFMNDLRSAKRSSLGNLITNGDFEIKRDDNSPKWWSTAVIGNGSFSYMSSNSNQYVQHGVRSLMVRSNDGTQVTYTTTNALDLQVGQAYMISGWVHASLVNTSAGLFLIDSNSTVLASSETSAIPWQRLIFRYPSTGTVTAQTIAFLKLSSQNGTSQSYFDDVQCTIIESVLWDSDKTKINVRAIPSDLSNPSENTGFRFVQTSAGRQQLCRYRIVNSNETTGLIREYFDSTNLTWTSHTELFAKNIKSLKFSFDPHMELPPLGPDTPLAITLTIGDPFSQGQSRELSNASAISMDLLAQTP